uniref:Major facilitator superfamily (MFS) profile domain-containing protein n=1 Tax=Timema douglasi TaxID=61478 RepID=A0A7R8Z8B6_TIMDO|nr:unnamed protein product [Timema douglasi]
MCLAAIDTFSLTKAATLMNDAKGTKKKRMMDAAPGSDAVQAAVGDGGRWQIIIYLWMSILKLAVAWHQLGIVFLAPPVDFRCHQGEPRNFTRRKVEHCSWTDQNGTDSPCTAWEYDRSVFTETIVTEWNLVCDRHQLANVAQTVFMFGVLMGNALFGMAADRFGRKKPLVLAILIQSLAGVASAFVPWFEVFLILRFIDAMATGGTMITSFVLCMELVGGWWRLVFSMISHIPFSLGHSLMAAIAYYARDWRTFQLAVSLPSIVLLSYWCYLPTGRVSTVHRAVVLLVVSYYEVIIPSKWPCLYRPSCCCPTGGELLRGYNTFQLAVSLPSIVRLSYWWTIPESPRWLLTAGRETEAIATLERAAKVNKRDVAQVVPAVKTFINQKTPNWASNPYLPVMEILVYYENNVPNRVPNPMSAGTIAPTEPFAPARHFLITAEISPVIGTSSFVSQEKRDSQDTNKKANILDLFRTPNLRLTTLCLYFNWLVCGFCFYGLAQYMGHLGGDIFVNIAVSGLIEMPGCVVCIYFMGRFGRRNTMISSQMLAATACLLIAVVPQGEGKPEWPKVMLAGLGIVGMSFSFPTVYLYSGELFPTVVRNVGVGSASMCARIGSMVAPFVSSLNHFSYYIPPLLFGLSPLAAALLTFLLPETADRDLPDTLEEGENFRLVLLWIHTFAEKNKCRTESVLEAYASSMSEPNPRVVSILMNSLLYGAKLIEHSRRNYTRVGITEFKHAERGEMRCTRRVENLLSKPQLFYAFLDVPVVLETGGGA